MDGEGTVGARGLEWAAPWANGDMRRITKAPVDELLDMLLATLEVRIAFS
jgi:hypothetical protein